MVKSKYIWIYLLRRQLPKSFFPTEKIVRVILSEHNINPRTKNLKPNFFKNRQGLSCIRLDFTNPNFCKKWGKHISDDKDRKYYGFACTYSKYINIYDKFWHLKYTPILDKKTKNPFHSDIFNKMYELENFESAAAEFNLLIEEIKEKWVINVDNFVNDEKWLNGEIKTPAL